MNFNKKLAVAVSGAVLLMAGQFALADSATDIVDALVSKGVLTEEEGKLITKGHTSKTAVTPVVKEKDGSFTIEDAKGRNSISLTGRIHLDYRQNNLDIYNTDYNDRDSASVADGFTLRRARLGVKGKFANDFKYEIVGNLPGTATVDVAFIDYAKFAGAQLRLGKFKQPFGLEQLTSSNNIDFMERSYVDQIAPAKKIGAMIFGEPKPGLTYALSSYSMNDTELDSKNDKANFAGRATLNFAQLTGNKDMVAHVGLSGFDNEYNLATTTTSSNVASSSQRATMLGFRTPGQGLSNTFRMQVGGEVNGNTTNAANISGQNINGNSTAQVKSHAIGLEGIFAYNNVKLQGEYAKAQYKGAFNRTETIGADANVYYGEILWLATGEKYSDAYKAGSFGSIKPKNNFDLDNNGWGAWEFGLKAEKYTVDDMTATSAAADTVNMTSNQRVQGSASCTVDATPSNGGWHASTKGQVNGCKSTASTYTAGVKWILNPNAMVKLNYSRTNFGYDWQYYDLDDAKVIKKEDLIMMRTQITF
jgi:phosphate-selective porin OprO and OprP